MFRVFGEGEHLKLRQFFFQHLNFKQYECDNWTQGEQGINTLFSLYKKFPRFLGLSEMSFKFMYVSVKEAFYSK
jgi:hypothetical protein